MNNYTSYLQPTKKTIYGYMTLVQMVGKSIRKCKVTYDDAPPLFPTTYTDEMGTIYPDVLYNCFLYLLL